MRVTLHILCSLLILAVAMPACAQETTSEEPAAAAVAETEDEKILYAMGLAIAQNLTQFNLDEAELKSLQKGLVDGVLGREPKVDLDEYGPKLQPFAQQRMQAAADTERDAAAAFVDEQAAAEGAEKTESGLIYSEITPGEGASPSATDTVTVHYHGTLRDGTVFDSSVDRGQPATFRLNQVIACWTEALQRMKVGGKSRIVCPPDLAYGDRGAGKIKPGSALVFEVELLGIGGQDGGTGEGGAEEQ